MKEKIGIATFHCAENYGAYLQAFALCNWIQDNISPDVRIINYRPSYLKEPYKISFKSRFKTNMSFVQKCKVFIAFCAEVPYRLVRKLKFRRAEHKLPLTGEYASADFQLDESYKGIVFGSDQIWNISLTKGIDPVYFGAIATNHCKKVAFAASIGLSEYPDEIAESVAEMLNQFDYIGVRERESVAIIQPMLSRQVSVNVDPVLLVERSYWEQFKRQVDARDYILVYCVRSNANIMQDAYRLAKMYNKTILHFGDPSIRPMFSDVEAHSLSYSGPFDFINYIAQADIILTDSFHATCFSTIFNRAFFTYLSETRSERLRTLAAIGKFSDRLVEWGETLKSENILHAFHPEEDYYQNYRVEQRNSQSYLENALKGLIDETDKNG